MKPKKFLLETKTYVVVEGSIIPTFLYSDVTCSQLQLNENVPKELGELAKVIDYSSKVLKMLLGFFLCLQ